MHMKSISNHLFGDDRRLIEKIMAQKCNFVYILKNSPCAKNIQLQLEIDTIGK